jgi:hypothetical protein
MKKTSLLLTLGIALHALPARASWATDAGPATCVINAGTTCTSTISPSSGSLVVVYVQWRQGDASISNVTDNKSDSYSIAYSRTVNAGVSTAVYYAFNIASGVTSVTVNFSATPTNGAAAICQSWTGEQTSSDPLDVLSSQGSGTGTSQASGNATTTGSGDLLVGVAYQNTDGTTNFAAAGSYTLLTNFSDFHDPDMMGEEYRLNVAAGTYASSFTTAGSVTWISNLVSFKGAAACTISHAARGGSTGGAHSATSIAVTVTAAIGDNVIVYCAETSSGGACTSVTDNASPANVYTAGPSQSTNVLTKIFYSLNIAHAPTTVTLTVSGTEGSAAVETYTISGGTFAAGNTGTNSGSSTAPAVTVTTQDAGNWIAMAGGASGAGTWSATAPNEVWHSAFSATTGGEISAASADNGANASTGSHTVTTALSTSEAWGAVGLELRCEMAAAGCPAGQQIALLGVGCR